MRALNGFGLAFELAFSAASAVMPPRPGAR